MAKPSSSYICLRSSTIRIVIKRLASLGALFTNTSKVNNAYLLYTGNFL